MCIIYLYDNNITIYLYFGMIIYYVF